MRKSADVLEQWLALTWERPERSYNPELRASFQELSNAATQTIRALEADYQDYQRRKEDIENNTMMRSDIQRRSRGRLELEFSFIRRLFEEALAQCSTSASALRRLPRLPTPTLPNM